jgi:hypothetical protein
MKSIVYLLGLAFIVLAVVYFTVPAGSLPTFIPGFEAGSPNVHVKHAIASGAVGVVLLVAGWLAGRRG